MRKIKCFFLLLLALTMIAPTLHAAGTGGFPSRPRFHEGYIIGQGGTSWFGNTSTWNGYMAVGAHHNGTAWVGDQIFGGIFGYENAAFKVYGNSGLIIGATYTPTTRFSIDATGVAAFTGTVTSTKACAAGYTRKGPNFCSRDATNSTNLARDVCTTDASLPSDAKAALVAVRAYAISTNAVGGPRSSKVFFFTSNTCATTLRIGVEAFGYEHTAVAASTLAGDAAEFMVPLDTNADFFIQQADDAGNTGAGQYSLNGYFD